MIIVGHRGARKEAPENTVASFVHAQLNGCQHFELDIQLSSDHQLMVFHDTTLVRTTGIGGTITGKPSAELTKLDARLNTPGWKTPCPIPTLQAVLDSVPDTRHWQIEVKSDSRFRLTILGSRLKAFIATNKLLDKVTVTSSDRWFLAHFKQIYPTIQTGYVAEYRLPNPVLTAQRLQCTYLILNVKLAASSLIQQAHAAGLNVSCWTVNSLEQMSALQEMGVDSIITDLPSLAIRHFC